MIQRARGGESDRAGLEGLPHQRSHRGDVLLGGGLLRHGAITHHVDAQRVMRNLGEEVDAVREAVERLHVLLEAFPSPANAL